MSIRAKILLLKKIKLRIFCLVILGFLLAPAIGVFGYKSFSRKYEIKPKEKVLGEEELGVTPTITPIPLPSSTSTPTPKPTFKPIPTNTPIPTSTPVLVPNTSNQQSSGGSTDQNVVNTVPIQNNNESDDGGYEEWSASQPKDSRGVLCINPDSRCKYECSVADFWVDDHLRILNNHLREYLIRLEIYEPDSHNVKIWENAVMNVYNMIYDECKDSPIYNPQNPL